MPQHYLTGKVRVDCVPIKIDIGPSSSPAIGNAYYCKSEGTFKMFDGERYRDIPQKSISIVTDDKSFLSIWRKTM